MAYVHIHFPDPVQTVLSGSIPEILEKIVEYAFETAAELCRLALVSRDWRMVSEMDQFWEPMCQQRGYTYDMFRDTPNRATSPMFCRSKWKALYVRIEMVKAKMRKGDGVWRAPVQFRLPFDDDHIDQARSLATSDRYLFVVFMKHNQFVVVYKKTNGSMLHILKARHRDGIGYMRANRDGNTLITNANRDAAVRIWNVEQAVCRHTILPQFNNNFEMTRFVYSSWNNRVILAEMNQGQMGRDLGLTLCAYNVMTGQLMQTSATMEGLYNMTQGLDMSGILLVSDGYLLTNTFDCNARKDLYALWDINYLTCLTVIEEEWRGSGRGSRTVLLNGESESIVSLTRRPFNANGTDTVMVWDFNGTLKLQLQTSNADRFHDAVLSQCKLIVLHSQAISVWCVPSGKMEYKVDLKPGNLVLCPTLRKYIYDHTISCAPRSYMQEAYMYSVLGADLMRRNRQTLVFPDHMDILVQGPSGPQCHTINFHVPSYP